ncbi:MAG TPA: orotidine-5'-phosphate decarboxylase, partial [Acidimicrobiales bacterium]|nr:orotidine-5'-phosphate decarboxylase [Acidimicrobiales bacterium]
MGEKQAPGSTAQRAAPEELRRRLALALDVDDLVVAHRLAKELRPWFGVAKVGLELYSATGPDVVVEFANAGYRVFLDLKFHDIPTTVGRAARVMGALGASFLTLHAHGGVSMLRAGVEGLAEGAEGAGLEPPTALAVTILTSDGDAPSHVLGNRVRAAVESGCGGIVCAASDVREAKQLAPRLLAVVPGIRLPGASPDDQARASTPHAAFAAGADLLVVGRAVTAARDPVTAAATLVEGLTEEVDEAE